MRSLVSRWSLTGRSHIPDIITGVRKRRREDSHGKAPGREESTKDREKEDSKQDREEKEDKQDSEKDQNKQSHEQEENTYSQKQEARETIEDQSSLGRRAIAGVQSS
ncbi:MAG: hypothetical protein ACO1NY_08450 [Pseudorhodoplanes sp.]